MQGIAQTWGDDLTLRASVTSSVHTVDELYTLKAWFHIRYVLLDLCSSLTLINDSCYLPYQVPSQWRACLTTFTEHWIRQHKQFVTSEWHFQSNSTEGSGLSVYLLAIPQKLHAKNTIFIYSSFWLLPPATLRAAWAWMAYCLSISLSLSTNSRNVGRNCGSLRWTNYILVKLCA